MNNFIDFLEKHLGKVLYGWSKDENGVQLPFQIVKYSNGPFPGTVTYSTLGLSNEPLISPVSGKEIQQELVFVADSNFGDKNIPGILQQIGLTALETKQAYLRGNVIGPCGPLFDGLKLEALYVSIPVYYPETFYSYDMDDNRSIVMVMLVPITVDEADFISENGWDKFEEILEEVDPDLIEFDRESIFGQ